MIETLEAKTFPANMPERRKFIAGALVSVLLNCAVLATPASVEASSGSTVVSFNVETPPLYVPLDGDVESAAALNSSRDYELVVTEEDGVRIVTIY